VPIVEEPTPERPAQLAELPQPDTVMRPEVEEYVPPVPPVRGFDADEDDEGELDLRGHHGRGHRWDRPGHRGRGHRE
jgi:hypothetical protein